MSETGLYRIRRMRDVDGEERPVWLGLVQGESRIIVWLMDNLHALRSGERIEIHPVPPPSDADVVTTGENSS